MMPGLIAFNRRWAIGTDDFVFPCVIEIFLRSAWLAAVAVVYNLHHETFFQCEGGHLLRMYYIGLMTLLCICIVICSVIVFISSRGSITNTGPRKKIVKILYFKLAIAIPELVWNFMGTYWSFLKSSSCDSFAVDTAKGTVISGWILAVVVLIGIAIVFDPLGKQNNPKLKKSFLQLESDDKQQLIESALMTTKKVWEKRCKLLCCCILGDEQSKGAFDEISNLLADFFQDVDLVPTDIAAGLILLQNEQEKEMNKGGKSYQTFSDAATTSAKKTEDESSICITDPPSWMTTSVMHHFMNYAMGSYGWPLYIFSNFTTGLCRLCDACRCCSCFMGGNVIDDNCCQCHTAAIRKSTRIADDDLLYVSFHNQIYEIPFYVAIDRDQQAVVVAIRGTLSFKDAITDLSAESETLKGYDNFIAHKGILQAAQYVQSELQNKHILQMAFERAQGARLVITGHSLGAGTAALLSLLLKPDYPDLICFAFSPPGGLLSKNASQYCQDFICSVIVGKDLVPRLGLVSMEDLKAKTLQCISSSRMPKFRILAQGVWHMVCCCCDECNLNSNNDSLIEDATGNSTHSSIEGAIQNTIQAREQFKITHTPMFPPGRIIHIQEIDRERKCFESPSYYAQWKKAEDFTEIIVGPEMLFDHLPDNVLKALEQLSEKGFTPKVKKTHSLSVSVTDV